MIARSALVPSVIALAVVAGSVRAGEPYTAEVRVAAQRLDDGRTEFALQTRNPDGTQSRNGETGSTVVSIEFDLWITE